MYCVVRKYKPQLKNVARCANAFVDKTGFERKNAYDEYYNQIKLEINDLETKILEYDEKIRRIYSDDIFCIICGKHYISSLEKYLRNHLGCNFRDRDFRWFLICHFDISKLLEFCSTYVLFKP